MAGMTAPDKLKEGMEPLSLASLQQALHLTMNEVEAKFSKSLESALSPILQQLKGFQASLSKTAQVAETALEVGVALQEA